MKAGVIRLVLRKKKKPEPGPRPGQAQREIHSDVLGSYTGVPEGGGEPEQDADDL